jgi:hypothetical protein
MTKGMMMFEVIVEYEDNRARVQSAPDVWTAFDLVREDGCHGDIREVRIRRLAPVTPDIAAMEADLNTDRYERTARDLDRFLLEPTEAMLNAAAIKEGK